MRLPCTRDDRSRAIAGRWTPRAGRGGVDPDGRPPDGEGQSRLHPPRRVGTMTSRDDPRLERSTCQQVGVCGVPCPPRRDEAWGASHGRGIPRAPAAQRAARPGPRGRRPPHLPLRSAGVWQDRRARRLARLPRSRSRLALARCGGQRSRPLRSLSRRGAASGPTGCRQRHGGHVRPGGESEPGAHRRQPPRRGGDERRPVRARPRRLPAHQRRAHPSPGPVPDRAWAALRPPGPSHTGGPTAAARPPAGPPAIGRAEGRRPARHGRRDLELPGGGGCLPRARARRAPPRTDGGLDRGTPAGGDLAARPGRCRSADRGVRREPALRVRLPRRRGPRPGRRGPARVPRQDRDRRAVHGRAVPRPRRSRGCRRAPRPGGARQPVPRPARRRGALVPLSPPLRRLPPVPARRGGATRSSTSAPPTGSSVPASRRRRSTMPWPPARRTARSASSSVRRGRRSRRGSWQPCSAGSRRCRPAGSR